MPVSRACNRPAHSEIQAGRAPPGTRPAKNVAWTVLRLRLAEERQDRLRVAVGDRQRLDAELLLDLQSLEAGRFLVHVGVDELADAAVDGVHQDRGRALLQ